MAADSRRGSKTAADVVLFQEHRWTAPRLPEQRARIRKKGWDVTLLPALQSERSESTLSGGTGIACRAGIKARMCVAWTLAAPRETAVGQCSSAWWAGRGQRVHHHGNWLLRAEHCVFEHVGPGSAGDRFALYCGRRLQPGWRCARAVNDTPTCLDSTGNGKVINFFVVTEELHPFVRTVMVDERPTVIRTHRPVVLTLEGVKRGRLVKGYAGLPQKDCASGRVEKTTKLR